MLESANMSRGSAAWTLMLLSSALTDQSTTELRGELCGRYAGARDHQYKLRRSIGGTSILFLDLPALTRLHAAADRSFS